MIVAIHQPCFLPWLGYLQRMAQADLFVILDHVQFEKENYQNRTRILTDGEPLWLTVPLVQRSHKERILDKEIDNRVEGSRWWARRQFATLQRSYRNSGFFNAYAPELKSIFESRMVRLADLNRALLELLREAFDIRTPLVKSSALGVSGAKSDLVLEICKAAGADTFLGGMGGTRAYLDREAFARAGIGVAWQEFRHPTYRQCGSAPFIAGLSSLDLLFNCGPKGRDLFLADEAAWQDLRVAA